MCNRHILTLVSFLLRVEMVKRDELRHIMTMRLTEEYIYGEFFYESWKMIVKGIIIFNLCFLSLKHMNCVFSE